ncbi:MAG: hypothetical protein R2818_15055 [Flavobacteriales bacterium]
MADKWEAYVKSVPVEGQLPVLPALSTQQERNYLAGRGVLDQYYGIRALYERLSKYVITAPFDGVQRPSGARYHCYAGHALSEFIAPDHWSWRRRSVPGVTLCECWRHTCA